MCTVYLPNLKSLATALGTLILYYSAGFCRVVVLVRVHPLHRYFRNMKRRVRYQSRWSRGLCRVELIIQMMNVNLYNYNNNSQDKYVK
jgi:hypothetical protein